MRAVQKPRGAERAAEPEAAGGWENVKGKERVFWAWPTLDARPSFAALCGAGTLSSVGLRAGGSRRMIAIVITLN